MRKLKFESFQEEVWDDARNKVRAQLHDILTGSLQNQIHSQVSDHPWSRIWRCALRPVQGEVWDQVRSTK